MDIFINIRHNCAFQENWKSIFCEKLCTWILDENEENEEKHGYANICCIAISKLSFRKELC